MNISGKRKEKKKKKTMNVMKERMETIVEKLKNFKISMFKLK